MSNTTEKIEIANEALLSVGQKIITKLTGTPDANKINTVLEKTIKGLLCSDWFFNRKRALITDMVKVQKLTVDTAPSPASWYVGSTITGDTSHFTCEIIEALTDKIYLVSEPSGDFTDGEELSDGTNSIDCAAGYPVVDKTVEYGSWDYAYKVPTDLVSRRFVGSLYFDDCKLPFSPEGDIILTNQTEGFLHYNKYVGENGSLSVSDVTRMPGWFHRLISARLAYILAPNVTENMKFRQKAEIEWKEAFLDAKEENGLQCYNENEQGNNDWVDGVSAELTNLY